MRLGAMVCAALRPGVKPAGLSEGIICGELARKECLGPVGSLPAACGVKTSASNVTACPKEPDGRDGCAADG
jgi:hypothetical protein